jgi:hypothetical protein
MTKGKVVTPTPEQLKEFNNLLTPEEMIYFKELEHDLGRYNEFIDFLDMWNRRAYEQRSRENIKIRGLNKENLPVIFAYQLHKYFNKNKYKIEATNEILSKDEIIEKYKGKSIVVFKKKELKLF